LSHAVSAKALLQREILPAGGGQRIRRCPPHV